MRMNRKILDLAIPNIISNISIPLLGIVDMALMGHLESDAYIGAIALGSLIFNFIYWSLGFLRMGTSGFTAQARGKRDLREAILVFSRAFFIAMGISIVLLLLRTPMEWLSFTLLKGEARVEELAASYFRIRVWAAPAALGQFALLGFFLGTLAKCFACVFQRMANGSMNWPVRARPWSGSRGRSGSTRSACSRRCANRWRGWNTCTGRISPQDVARCSCPTHWPESTPMRRRNCAGSTCFLPQVPAFKYSIGIVIQFVDGDRATID